MSVDYRPYLREGDLRTPEEVAAWMRSLSLFTRERPWRQDLDGACDELDERLDRERRQACRRAARQAFSQACRIMRAAMDTRGRRRDRELSDAAWSHPSMFYWPHKNVSWNDVAELLNGLAKALAFRAAARAK